VISSSSVATITSLADRILVMYDGRIVGNVEAVTPREELGLLMAGAQPSAARSADA